MENDIANVSIPFHKYVNAILIFLSLILWYKKLPTQLAWNGMIGDSFLKFKFDKRKILSKLNSISFEEGNDLNGAEAKFHIGWRFESRTQLTFLNSGLCVSSRQKCFSWCNDIYRGMGWMEGKRLLSDTRDVDWVCTEIVIANFK